MRQVLAFLQRFRPLALQTPAASTPSAVPTVRDGVLYLSGEIVSEYTANLLKAWGFDGGMVSSDGFAEALAKEKVTSVIVNSIGGEVAEGIVIANAIRRADLPVTVDGYACSIASVIVAASRKVRLSPGAMVMMHKPHSGAMGNATALRAEADVLDVHEEAMVDIYGTRMDKARARALLKGPEGSDGSWGYRNGGDKAGTFDPVSEGLADEYEEGEEDRPTLKAARAMASAAGLSVPTLADPVAPVSPKAEPRAPAGPEGQTVTGRRRPHPGG
jgi:ATP-dependent Clp protease protease subunit